MSLRVAVVDDEGPARERLADLLSGREDVQVAATCDGGRSAIRAIESTALDLVFLDIQMPEIDGFGVLEAVGPERMPAVVFVTAFEEHAVHAFEVRALDYLLKPFDRVRLERALGHARQQLAAGAGPRQQRLADVLRARQEVAAPLDRVLVRDGELIHVVPTADIDWIGAAGNYVELHVGPGSYLLRSTLTQLQGRLPARAFLRIHRETIVQVDRIRRLQRLPGALYQVVLRDGTERPVGRSFQAVLEARLGGG
jgi:two-component system, LytTR family, response regulator